MVEVHGLGVVAAYGLISVSSGIPCPFCSIDQIVSTLKRHG